VTFPAKYLVDSEVSDSHNVYSMCVKCEPGPGAGGQRRLAGVTTWEPLAAGYKGAFVWRGGLVAGQGGRPVGAVWMAVRDVVNPITTPPYAVFHSQWPEWRIYLPLVIRNHS
jgi:hypothetical protein